MTNVLTTYLKKPVEIPKSKVILIGFGMRNKAYCMFKEYFTGLEEFDYLYAFPLMPYLMRLAENGEPVPDLKEVKKLIEDNLP